MNAKTYSIHLDGDWSLDDFSAMPKPFLQLYSFHFHFVRRGKRLAFSAESDFATELIEGDGQSATFNRYPWQGGYSVVHFFDTLKVHTPDSFRPQVRRIAYASPGFIELGCCVAVALSVGKVIKIVCDSASTILRVYNEYHQEASRRNLLRLEVQEKEISVAKQRISLRRDQLEFVREANAHLSSALKIRNVEALDRATGSPLRTMKVLMAYYRRLKVLMDFVEKGMVYFPDDSDDSPQ